FRKRAVLCMSCHRQVERSATAGPNYRQERQMPTRLRRKLVRCSMGRARRRRIKSRTARSFAFVSASSFTFLVIRGFFKQLLQQGKDGQVLRTASGLLALDDISESSNQDLHRSDTDKVGSLAETFKR